MWWPSTFRALKTTMTTGTGTMGMDGDIGGKRSEMYPHVISKSERVIFKKIKHTSAVKLSLVLK